MMVSPAASASFGQRSGWGERSTVRCERLRSIWTVEKHAAITVRNHGLAEGLVGATARSIVGKPADQSVVNVKKKHTHKKKEAYCTLRERFELATHYVAAQWDTFGFACCTANHGSLSRRQA